MDKLGTCLGIRKTPSRPGAALTQRNDGSQCDKPRQIQGLARLMTLDVRSVSGQEKLLPQPQDLVTLGFSIAKPAPIRPSL